jgi:dGTPase
LSIDQNVKAEGPAPARAGGRAAAGEAPRARAPYATDPSASRGRLELEQPCPTRSPYARDRDRILHATAFRRLNYKTQVFIYHEGDHYRSRLTHTLEVAQIARALARTLGVDEDLTEALALAHDLGHPPFGHAGERALDAAMKESGGFDHNAQSLRVVAALEKKYARFDGLNLTWETLEGLVKHNGPLTGPRAAEPREVPEPIRDYCAKHDLELATFASVEAQAAALADDIAYNNHDVDDGYRAGFFTFAELAEVPIAARALAEVREAYPGIDGTRLLYEAIRRLISAMIEDAVAESERRLAALQPRSVADIRHAPHAVVAFSEAMRRDLDSLRAFLFARVYRNERIVRVMADAERVVRDLFQRYAAEPEALPPDWREPAPPRGTRAYDRHVADFIAGMTDRFALAEHRRLFDATPELR